MESSNISIVPFSPQAGDVETLAELVECYRDVFADEPWNEWLKCNDRTCREHWGRHEGARLASMRYQHCLKPVVDYWPRQKVVKELLEHITSESTCFLAVEERANDSRIVGFTWGMPIHLIWSSLESDVQAALTQLFHANVANDPTIVYQREIGVISSHRKSGIGRRLARERHKEFLLRGYRYAIMKVREYPVPSVTFLWYMKLGFRVIYRYPREDGRVILMRELTPNLFA